MAFQAENIIFKTDAITQVYAAGIEAEKRGFWVWLNAIGSRELKIGRE
jgi:hypothetical protein